MEAYLEDNRPILEDLCREYKHENCEECPAYEFCYDKAESEKISMWRDDAKEFAAKLRFAAECIEYYCKVSTYHSCNDCGISRECEYCPAGSEQVRINCPLWRKNDWL